MYSPSAVQAPGFTDKNQSNINGSISGRGYDIHGGYAVSNHFALLGSWYWRHERQYDHHYTTAGFPLQSPLHIDSIRYNRNLLSIGLSYFTPMDKKQHFYFTVSGGYGAGHLGMFEIERYKQRDYDTTNQVHQYDYHSAITNIFLQPSIMFSFKSVKIIFSVRQSEIYFRDINTNYSQDVINISEGKVYGFTEPDLTLKFHPNVDWLTIQLQSGISLPFQNVSFDFRPLIGNIGISVDPVKLLSKKTFGNEVK